MEKLEDALMASQNNMDANSLQNDISSLISNSPAAVTISLSHMNNQNLNSNNNNNNNNINMNSNNSNNNNNNGNSNQGANGMNSTINLERSTYTMPGILHYLQHEWNRYELDRQQWEVEKTELMTKISFLQGERRGQENLKQNLIRRIKMLELALKQERSKYNRLKFGNETNLSDLKLPTTNSNEDPFGIENNTFMISQHPILNKENNSNANATKNGRQILKQYLQEIGYTDNIIDIRSARLRSLLGLKAAQSQPNTANLASLNFNSDSIALNQINPNDLNELCSNAKIDQLANLLYNNNNGTGPKQQQQQQNNLSNNAGNGSVSSSSKCSINTNSISNQQLVNGDSTTAKINLKSHNVIQQNNNSPTSSSSPAEAKIQNKQDSNMTDEYDSNDDSNGPISSSSSLSTSDEHNHGGDQSVDSDTENALKEFSFLSNDSSYSSSDNATEWNVDKAQLLKLTEQYRKDRTSKSMSKAGASVKSQQQAINSLNAQRPNRATLQEMISNLNNSEDETSLNQENASPDSTTSDSSNSSGVDGPSESSVTGQNLNNLNFSNSTKLFLEDESFGNDANLGELSHISVTNGQSSNALNDETILESASKKTISNKYSLRGHFDSVRCLAFHPSESVLVTGSEDQTIKLWNLDKTSVSNKKNVNSDLEPIYTFRMHSGPVLSLLISSSGDYVISGGLDGHINVWNMPNYDSSDQYDNYSPSLFVKSLNGHTDAVWSMALIDNILLSVSSDSTIRLWTPFGIDELNESVSFKSSLNENGEEGIPTSISFMNNDKSRFVTSFSNSHHNIYDTETSKIVTRFDFKDSENAHCYKVMSFSNSTSSTLVISAHEDKKIRFFDTKSGKLAYQMVAHQDACTDLAIDPSNSYLLSSSHDCSLRLWNLENKSCVQEITSHRKKYDESINCVAFHPTKQYIASGGADAIVKIFV